MVYEQGLRCSPVSYQPDMDCSRSSRALPHQDIIESKRECLFTCGINYQVSFSQDALPIKNAFADGLNVASRKHRLQLVSARFSFELSNLCGAEPMPTNVAW
jgi:hypothetical protein